MGQLDDAIREHLELKRRRGADTAEVTRQEQEAFGPPRRGDFETAPAAVAAEHDDPELPLNEPLAFADEPAPTALHVVEDHYPAQTDPPRPHGDPADDLPRTAPESPPEAAAPAQAEPPPPHGDPADELPPADDQPTRAFNAEEVRAATTPPPLAPSEPVAPPEPKPEPARDAEPEPAPAGATRMDEEDEGADDVLEETPEFLQETPEHDRLWFEQRPPRDFDF